MSNNRFTPELIANSNQVFNIPLYQRLFEWGDKQIERLLDDLYQAYNKTPDKPYYIGMLTAMPHNSILDLVDGQQRFTVMMLLGKTFGWDDFTKTQNNNPRLKFAARPSDERYLKSLLGIEHLSGEELEKVQNYKMSKGLKFIDKYLKNVVTDRVAFGEYIKKNLTFFVTKLEDSYTITELNTYFERMNTTGKALEQHEILKVTLLNKLDQAKREAYTKIWNACSMMDRMLYRPKSSSNDSYDEELDSDPDSKTNSYESCRKAYFNAIRTLIHPQIEDNSLIETIADEIYKDNDDYTSTQRIRDIEQMSDPEKDNPNKQKNKRRGIYAMPTFPEFLLQVLFITLGSADDLQTARSVADINGLRITDFFNDNKLNDTFHDCLNEFQVEAFFHNLLLYRLILDYYMVRVSENDEEPYPFRLYKENQDNKRKKDIIQYETMLYAASSPMTYYYWIAPFLVWIGQQIEKYDNLYIDENEILKTLETLDKQWHPNICDDENVAEQLRYGNIDRYYFWRIDYYLWKNRDTLFKEPEEKDLASSYIFRRNRSIEHIAPQHYSENKTQFNWAELEQNDSCKARLKDSIGNLCMISSGQNSSLKDSAFEEKRGHIESFLNDSIKGYVESLKMLYVYSRYDEWTLENIKAHENESIDWLKKSYEEGLT